MGAKTDAYLDTSALIAFLDRSDSYHSIFKRLFSAPPRLATSALVIAEGHGWFLRRYDQRRALQFLTFVEQLSPLKVAAFSHADIAPAKVLLKKFKDQRLTLTDVHGLSIMQQQSIQSCWSTDRHLGLTGVRLVIQI